MEQQSKLTMKQLHKYEYTCNQSTVPGLKKKPVHSSRASILYSQASNCLSSLAPLARNQAIHPPTKFLITILNQRVSFKDTGIIKCLHAA